MLINETIMAFIFFVINFYGMSPIKPLIPIPFVIQEITLPEIVIKAPRMMSNEERLYKEVLDSIPKRESRFDVIGNIAYTLISSTGDYGKYQLNQVNFRNGGICYGLTFQQFLLSPKLQEEKAVQLMKYNIAYLKSINKPINRIRLHISWWGLGIAGNDNACINLLYRLKASGHLKENVDDLIKELNTNLL